LGDGREHGDDPAWDAAEAEALYERLEREVIPEFYARDDRGIPTAWVARMRESMARLTPVFSANRTVRQYTEQHYLPAAAAFRARQAGQGAIARRMVDWRQTLEGKWLTLRFGEVKSGTKGDQHLFEVQVYLGEVSRDAVQVELYADAANDGRAREPLRLEMKRIGSVAGVADGHVYAASVPATRSTSDYTARVIPYYDGVAVPLEAARILWQR
jgi:starch phosphorylase